MKKLLLLLLLVAPLSLLAQEADGQQTVQPYFGYLSYHELFTAMPEYQEAQDSLNILKAKYEAEIKRADEEFNKKYAEFIQDQKSFPDAILKRRQKELQLLMERSIDFKGEIRDLMRKAQDEMTAPVTARLQQAIAVVAESMGLHYVLNTDHNNYPYLNPLISVDITAAVRQQLGM